MTHYEIYLTQVRRPITQLGRGELHPEQDLQHESRNLETLLDSPPHYSTLASMAKIILSNSTNYLFGILFMLIGTAEVRRELFVDNLLCGTDQLLERGRAFCDVSIPGMSISW
jgi:hypothetical protein